MERKRGTIPSARARKRGTIPSARTRKRGKRGKEKVDDIESQEQLGPSIADLPFPIITDILLRLPVKLVLVCKHVCRTWNTLISDPHFAKLHFDRSRLGFLIRAPNPVLVSRTMYLLEDEPRELGSKRKNILKLEPTFKLPLRDAKLVLDKQDGTDGLLVCKTEDRGIHVVNSCNGLLCLSEPFNDDPLVVCNPVTGEFIRLPKVIKGSKGAMSSSIGFQTKTNEYKVVRIIYGILNVEINVVGTPTWRNVRVDGNFSEIEWLLYPTSVNEALHWICFAGGIFSILCFNFETEKLQLIYLPSPTSFEPNGISIGVLRDSLYVCNASLPSSVDVWIMKNDDTGVLWTKAFKFGRSLDRMRLALYWPLKNFDNENCILEYCSKKGFIYYDTKNRPKNFRVCGTEEKPLEVIPHIPSLISLKDVVKGDNVEVQNVNSRCAKVKLPEE